MKNRSWRQFFILNPQEFECPICLGFWKTPKSLPCNHTFCETCLNDAMTKGVGKDKNANGMHACPVCKHEFKKREAAGIDDPCMERLTTLVRRLHRLTREDLDLSNMLSQGMCHQFLFWPQCSGKVLLFSSFRLHGMPWRSFGGLS
jgi:hypothetical protein